MYDETKLHDCSCKEFLFFKGQSKTGIKSNVFLVRKLVCPGKKSLQLNFNKIKCVNN